MTTALFPAIATLTGLFGAFVGYCFPIVDAQPSRGSDSLRAERLPSLLKAEENIEFTEAVRVPARSAGESVIEHELQSLSWIRELVRWDPDRAFATALVHHEETGDSTLLKGVVASLGASNPQQAIELIRTLSAEFQAELVPGLANAVLEENPDAAIQLFEAGLIELCERDTIGRAFDSFASAHPEKAATWILKNRESSSEIDDVLSPFLKVQGGLETVIDVLGSDFSSFGDFMKEDLFFITTAKLKTKFADPAAAMAFADTIDDPQARDIYQAAIARDLLDVDVDQAIDFFTNRLSPTFAEESASNFLKLLSTLDLDKALESVGDLIPDVEQEGLRSMLYGFGTLQGLSLSEEQAESYIDLVNSGSGSATPEIVNYRFMTMFNEIMNGTRAWEWLHRLDPENEVRLGALSAMARRHLEVEPRITSEVLANYPETPGRDDFVVELIGYITDDPERALQWASYISEPGLRVSALDQGAKTLQGSDPEELQRWLSTSPLTSDEQAIVREAVAGENAP